MSIVNKRIMKAAFVIGLSAVVLLAVVVLAPRTESVSAAPNSADEPVRQQISVTGTGSVTAEPDQAVITIGVQITAPTLEQATKEASERMTAVLTAIKGQGIDPKEIQTSTYSVSPLMNYQDGKDPVTTGYQVTNIVNVTVKDLTKVGAVLDAGMAAGANYLGGISFGIADPAPHQTEARTKAVQNATHIAQVYADAAGVKLGRVLTITEGAANVPPPVAYKSVFAENSASPGPVQSGSLDITTTVGMTFEIIE